MENEDVRKYNDADLEVEAKEEKVRLAHFKHLEEGHCTAEFLQEKLEEETRKLKEGQRKYAETELLDLAPIAAHPEEAEKKEPRHVEKVYAPRRRNISAEKRSPSNRSVSAMKQSLCCREGYSKKVKNDLYDHQQGQDPRVQYTHPPGASSTSRRSSFLIFVESSKVVDAFIKWHLK